MAVALTVFGSSSAQAFYIDYSADAAVSSDGCYVYGTESDWATGADVITIQTYGQTALDTYTGADAGNLSPSCPTEVTVPSEIDGKAIDWIGGSAFRDSGITAITIPSSIDRVLDYALYSQQLRSINIEGSPTIDRRFVNAPIDLLSYNGSTFRSSDPVTEQCFEFDADSGEIMRYKYLHRLYLERDGILCLSRNVNIPKTINGAQVRSIGYGSFASSPSEPGPIGTPEPLNFLESVVIPEGVNTIGAGAFSYGRLKSVVIPSSVTSMHPFAFDAQNPAGSNINYELNSGDPDRVQAAYKTINYVQLKLADPTNPHGLMSSSFNKRGLAGLQQQRSNR